MIGLAVLVVAAVAFSDLMGGRTGSGLARQGQSGQGMMQGQWWTWGLDAFIVLGVLLIGSALVARALGLGRRRHSSARDVLKRRYAAGDLTRDHDEQMRKDLDP